MFTVVKIRRISRLDVVCKKHSYACAPPAIEIIYIVEKHNTLITTNFSALGFVSRSASLMTARSAREDFA